MKSKGADTQQTKKWFGKLVFVFKRAVCQAGMPTVSQTSFGASGHVGNIHVRHFGS